MSEERFDFEFEPRFRLMLLGIGVTPRTASVTVTNTRLIARFGLWTCETPLTNVRDTCMTGPYQWIRAIGARASAKDRGATFGTTTAGGVCMLFRKPVTALEPFGVLRHPGLTVTLEDRERFNEVVRKRAGLPS
jgi:hypothetical protein